MGIAMAASLLGALVFVSSTNETLKYLQSGDFNEDQAKAIASFSHGEIGWFIFFLMLSLGSVLLMLSGWFAGARARWAGVLLGIILVVDLARANHHWIVYEDSAKKYATNPILDLLRKDPYQQRVTARISPLAGNYLV